jgi:hypothetical protein
VLLAPLACPSSTGCGTGCWWPSIGSRRKCLGGIFHGYEGSKHRRVVVSKVEAGLWFCPSSWGAVAGCSIEFTRRSLGGIFRGYEGSNYI